ncbi:DUF6506 family protein [uncultured Ruthenibacterium sp.]|uniref:DUF6506 family protein n=1 Tax=uncultured Ruthenibacterium sp. TaxID=1905347 RepID=UPI00349E7207
MKKYAFLLWGNYDPERHCAEFIHGDCLTRICTVRSFEQAEQTVLSLWKEGFGAVELCGAFGQDRALRLSELTQGQVAIGYVTHDPSQDHLFQAFFGD